MASSRGHACTQQPQLPVTSPHMIPCHMHNSCRLSFPFSDSGATGSIQRRSCDCKYYTQIHTRLPRENAATNEYLSRLFSGCARALLHIVTYSGSEHTEISNTEMHQPWASSRYQYGSETTMGLVSVPDPTSPIGLGARLPWAYSYTQYVPCGYLGRLRLHPSAHAHAIALLKLIHVGRCRVYTCTQLIPFQNKF